VRVSATPRRNGLAPFAEGGVDATDTLLGGGLWFAAGRRSAVDVGGRILTDVVAIPTNRISRAFAWWM
jgi:hypothetical protein